MMAEALRRELAEIAKKQPPEWTGDLNDDCGAKWGVVAESRVDGWTQLVVGSE